MNDEKVIARVAIVEASHMTLEGRKEVASWLRHCADMLEKDGHGYAKLFQARYIAVDKKAKVA